MDSNEAVFPLRNPPDLSRLICERNFVNEKGSSLKEKGWETFVQQAKEWSEIAIPTTNEKYIYTKVFGFIKDGTGGSKIVHSQCRVNFRTKRDEFRKRYTLLNFILSRLLRLS